MTPEPPETEQLRGPPPRVYISYAWEDRDTASSIREQLAENGVNVAPIDSDVPPGSLWAEKVTEAIDSAESVLVLLTSSSTASGAVRRELAYAVSQQAMGAGKRIIPVLIEPGTELPFFLRNRVSVDLTDPEAREAALDRLVVSVKLPPPSPEELERALAREFDMLKREKVGLEELAREMLSPGVMMSIGQLSLSLAAPRMSKAVVLLVTRVTMALLPPTVVVFLLLLGASTDVPWLTFGALVGAGLLAGATGYFFGRTRERP